MCDTLVISKRLSANRENILAKNSDRPLGECQLPELFPAGTVRKLPAFVREEDRSLFEGTGLSPEGSRFAVLGSRPYWLYGFEMGANEKGLFIGNEAEGSRCPAEPEDGILGMDLLRYALESCSDAKEAIGRISVLLQKYGQSANASRLFDRRYENTCILADPKELWVMETAGRHWAAKKITWFEAVSNCYTIGTDYDLCSDGMEAYVRENRLLHPDDPVDFSKAFTRPAVRQRFSVPRRNRMIKLVYEILTGRLSEEEAGDLMAGITDSGDDSDLKILKELQKTDARISPADLPYIFRDHFEEEINEFRFGPLGGENVSICMHANTQEEAQTAASMIMTYDKQLGFRFHWAPASPCTGIYLPVWWVRTETAVSPGPDIPEILRRGGEFYDPESLWWVMERLVTLAGVCEERYFDPVLRQMAAVETHAERLAADAEKEASRLIRSGKTEEAQKLLDRITAQLAGELYSTACCLCDSVSEEIAAAGGLYGPRKEFTAAFAARTRMPV